jgi:urease accessory protein
MPAEAPSRASPVPLFVRATGGVRLSFARDGAGASRIADWHESGGYRARFPTRHDTIAEAVLINTGGGMTGGDALRQEITVGERAHAVVTSQAAEKIYRSDGPVTSITTDLAVAPGATLAWVPQETILFDRAYLSRRLTAEMAADATLIAAETMYFGRAAMGEGLREGSWRDSWRIRRAGRLVFAEDVRLEGDLAAALARRAVADGARAVSTILLVAPDAAARLEPLRALTLPEGAAHASSHVDGCLVTRVLAREAAPLREAVAMILTHHLNAPLPRSWQC